MWYMWLMNQLVNESVGDLDVKVEIQYNCSMPSHERADSNLKHQHPPVLLWGRSGLTWCGSAQCMDVYVQCCRVAAFREAHRTLERRITLPCVNRLERSCVAMRACGHRVDGQSCAQSATTCLKPAMHLSKSLATRSLRRAESRRTCREGGRASW